MFYQTDDGWFNIWRCAEGNEKMFRPEKDGERPKESTKRAANKICKKCKNKCKGWFENAKN